MAEVMQLPAETVHEDDRPPLTRLDIVDAVSGDVDEFSDWWNGTLRPIGDPSRRQREIADDEKADQKDRAENPADDRSHAVPVSGRHRLAMPEATTST